VPAAPCYSLDHFRRALIDLSDLHYDDFPEIPDMNVAARIYLTAGVSIRFASKIEKCSWTKWKIESFSASPYKGDAIGASFDTAQLIIKSDSGKVITIRYAKSGLRGDAYLQGKSLLGWTA